MLSLYNDQISLLTVLAVIHRSSLWWPPVHNDCKNFVTKWLLYTGLTVVHSFWADYILFELKKKYRGVVFHDTEEGYKIWRGISLLFQNWHKEKFLTEDSKVSWARLEYIWKLNWKKSLLICFENCWGVPCSHRQSRIRRINTFIIVNITLICKL